MKQYIIACSKDWFLKEDKVPKFSNTDFVYLRNQEELTKEKVDIINPRFIFFPHWNWKVPSEVFDTYDCVAFHTSPLPFGRGGSPIQNLIVRNFKTSPVCALKMNGELDSGPIYDSMEVSLDGSITEIFSRIAQKIQLMILRIIEQEPYPKEQIGKPTIFSRRQPSESQLKESYSLQEIYDHIRMLDSEDYPRAFIKLGDSKIEFSEAEKKDNEIIATVIIKNK